MQNNFNLAQAVWWHSQTTPDAVAVVHQGQSLSYAQFAGRAIAVAQRLALSPDWPNRAIKPFKVGVLACRGTDAAVAILGACWAGTAYVPLGLKLPKDKLLAILAACEFSAIIVDAEGAKLLTDSVLAACPKLLIRVDLEASPQALAQQKPVNFQEPVQVNADDLSYVIFTSGTTGAPKGVMIAAGSVRNYIQTVAQKLNLQATDRALETCEITFDVSVHNMFATWQVGAAVYILPANLVMNAVKFAQTEHLTVWNSVPSLVGMLQQIKVLEAGSLPELRLSVFGGEALPESAALQWQQVAPNSEIVNLYGPTEATVFCLAKVFARNEPITCGRGFVSIGTPLGGCEAMVVDGTGKELTDGVPGELVSSVNEPPPRATAGKLYAVATCGQVSEVTTGDGVDDVPTVAVAVVVDDAVAEREAVDEVDAVVEMVPEPDGATEEASTCTPEATTEVSEVQVTYAYRCVVWKLAMETVPEVRVACGAAAELPLCTVQKS